jgi:DNA adenine methylase
MGSYLMTKLRPPIKIHGGKFYQSLFIIDQFPPNYEQMVYIEPFCGGSSVLLNKEPSKIEIINDIDEGIISIFECIKDPILYDSLVKILTKHISYNEDVFDEAKNNQLIYWVQDPVVNVAINNLVLYRMSRGGNRKNFSWSNRLRGGEPGDVHAWKTFIKDELLKIHQRLQKVEIFNFNAIKFITFLEHTIQSDKLYYIDPPYLQETRSDKNAYNYEMTENDHVELAKVLNSCSGKIIISGYNSTLYDNLYKGWRKIEHQVINRSCQQKILSKRQEVLWLNY